MRLSTVTIRWLRNVLAVAVGLVVGGAINLLLIQVSGYIVEPPRGVDLSSAADLRAAAHLLEPRHFVMPFLAHAIGTLSGALAAYLLAASRRVMIAMIVGIIFLAGGVAASSMLAAPDWFIRLDLLGAYLPMAWLATRIGLSLRARHAVS
jgi:hypothetical protein